MPTARRRLAAPLLAAAWAAAWAAVGMAAERGAVPAPYDVVALLPPAARSDVAAPPPGSHGEGNATVAVERFWEPSAPGSGWLEVEYTVRPRLDAAVRAVLERGRVALGHVIVLDPADGRVVSYVSTDPLRFPAWRAYPTASLMKVVTAAAVLRHAPEAATRDCRYAGSPYVVGVDSLSAPDRADHVDSFWRSLAISNNQCFARLAVRDVGAPNLVAEMRRAGMLERPAAGHQPGRIGHIATPLDLGELGSGLSGSFITPLAAARMAALLADGTLVRPHWIAGVRDASGRALQLPDVDDRVAAWPPALAEELRSMMVGVTERGTAKSAFRDAGGRPLLGPIEVAGKTGSLNGTNPPGRYEWFIGVAPADRPRVAIASLVVGGPHARANASRVAARVLREMFCTRGVCRPEALDAWLPRHGGGETAVGG